MHKITISCKCKRRIECSVERMQENKNKVHCVCGCSYYVHYNAHTKSYEYDLVSEDK